MDMPVVFSVLFYLFVSLLVGTVLVDSYAKKQSLKINWESNYLYLIPLFLIVLIGFRPVGVNGFMDSGIYEEWFHRAKLFGTSPLVDKDKFFGYFVLIISYFTNNRGFFIVCGFVSVSLLILTSRYVSKRYWILFFICHIASLYYWNYNVYGIRQGLGIAIFLYAFFVKNKWVKIILMFLSLGMHLSLVLPVAVYLLIIFIKKTYRFFYLIWIAAIPLSYYWGHEVEYFMSKWIPDKRAGYLTMDLDRKGFRWDMILYSLVLLAVSYYFIYFKKIKDKTYYRIVNLFIFTNTIFIFLIRANHAHRFAYLSWFLASLVIFYPFFISDEEKLKEKNKVFSQTLVVFFTFVLIHFFKITFF
jgi:hypothetical protein